MSLSPYLFACQVEQLCVLYPGEEVLSETDIRVREQELSLRMRKTNKIARLHGHTYRNILMSEVLRGKSLQNIATSDSVTD